MRVANPARLRARSIGAAGRKAKRTFRPDPNRQQPPVDKTVQLPEQVKRAAARAEALVTGKPMAPRPVQSCSDAEIEVALRSVDDLPSTQANRDVIIALVHAGAEHVKARRRGARRPREASDDVMRRLRALVEAYGELEKRHQKRTTGGTTIEVLRKAVALKLGLKAISDDTIKKDVRQVRPLLRLIEKGAIPAKGNPKRQVRFSDRTQQEMKAGKKASARRTGRDEPTEA